MQQQNSKTMLFDTKKAFFSLGLVIILIYALVQATAIVIPITYSVLIAFILMPVCNFFERKKLSRSLALGVTFAIAFVLILLFFFFFSTQVYQLIQDFDTSSIKIEKILDQATDTFNKYAPKDQQIKTEGLNKEVRGFITDSFQGMASGVFDQTSNFIANLAIIPFYIGLLLLYRRGIHQVLISTVKEKDKEIMSSMLYEIQQVGQKYVGGLGLIILILSVLNSTALFFIGIDSPLFFGFFAGCLAVIPYLGTYIGSGLPILYALFAQGSPQMALAVFLSFWAIQLIEGNFLSPRIVGGEVSLNPLTSIIAIIIGGTMWGLSGMILFLPMTAILRVFCSYHAELVPIAQLLGEDITNRKPKAPKKKTMWLWKKKNNPNKTDINTSDS